MVDTVADQEGAPRSGSRSLSSLAHAARWRDKLREKASKLKGASQTSVELQESDVSNFLGKGSENSVNRPLNLGLYIPTGDELDPKSYASPPMYHPNPPKLSKNLTVSFSDKEPDIIGEGGDECELPTQYVVGSWTSPSYPPGDNTASMKPTELPVALVSGSTQQILAPDRYDRRQSLQRAPTRKPVGGWVQQRLSINMEEGLVQAKKDDEISKKLGTLVPPYGSTSYAVPKNSSELNKGFGTQKAPSISNREPTIPRLDPPAALHSSSHAVNSPTCPLPKAYAAFDPRASALAPLNSTDTSQDRHSLHVPREDEACLSSDVSRSPSLPALSMSRNDRMKSTSSEGNTGLPVNDSNVIDTADGDEFYCRVQQLQDVFRPAAEQVPHIEGRTLENWLRMASWWFICGKTTLEKTINSLKQESARATSNETSQKRHQCYVDLAKAWWSIKDVLPDLIRSQNMSFQSSNLNDVKGSKYSHLLGIYENLKIRLNEYAKSMHHNNLLPPLDLSIEGADPCIWITYPQLSRGTLSLTASLDSPTLADQTKRPFFPILLNGKDDYFIHGYAFANAKILSSNGDEADQMPCLISIFRNSFHADVQLMVASQDGQIYLHIYSDPKQGLTWVHVNCMSTANTLIIHLSKDYRMEMAMHEDDYRLIISLKNLSHRLELQWHATKTEDILFDDTVPVFHITGTAKKFGSFLSTPIRNTAVRLFRRSAVTTEAPSQRTISDGYRFVAMVPSANGTPSCLEHIFADGSPILSSNLRGENEAPALLLAIRDSEMKTSLILTFKSIEQRSFFYMAISGVLLSHKEISSGDIPLSTMCLADLFEGTDQGKTTHKLCSLIRWNSVQVISNGHGEGLENILFSDSLRISSNSNIGTVVDLANLATGELQISLDVLDNKLVKLYRPAQENLIISFADNLFPKEEYSALQTTIRTMIRTPSARVYKFPTLDALHRFQQLVTGFTVIYDGLATLFSISHRRNMIPLYKKQEASQARLQILVQENRAQKTYQLLVVLLDFPDGKIMNVELRSTDVLEATMKAGKHCIRLANAKFALPKHPNSKDIPWDFVCLDAPEYPGEHDDIMIGFDTERGKLNQR